MNKTKHNCLLCMLSMQCISYSLVLESQLEMFSKCAQLKKHPDSGHFKNSYCFVFENGIKFRVFKFSAIFCLRVLNFANYLNREI